MLNEDRDKKKNKNNARLNKEGGQQKIIIKIACTRKTIKLRKYPGKYKLN